MSVASELHRLSFKHNLANLEHNQCLAMSDEHRFKNGRSPNRDESAIVYTDRSARPSKLRTFDLIQTPQRTQSMKQSPNNPRPTVMRRTYTTKQLERTRGASEPAKEFRARTFSSPREKRRDDEFNWGHKRASPSDADELMRMRTFTIDAKGLLINRGDSFRCRSNTAGSGSIPVSNNSTKSSSAYSSRCQSPLPDSAPPLSPDIPKYNILVLGVEAVGKTSIINQFMTSEFCTLFNSELIERPIDNTISVVLDGEESELTFIEVDTLKSDLWESLNGAGYLVIYSVNDEMSFKCAKEIVYTLREQNHTATKPIVLVGNKVDLERKRFVGTEEARHVAKENDCKFVEVSVALGHNVDPLLAGILRQIKLQADLAKGDHPHLKKLKSKTKLIGSPTKSNTTSCTNISHASRQLMSKLFNKKQPSKSVEDLFQN